MKRVTWAIAMVIVAIVSSVTRPAPMSASDPCYEHDCHNGYEYFQTGCLNGCAPLGRCNPSGSGR